MILHGIEYQRPTSLNMRIMADHVTYSFLAFMKSIFHFCLGCYCGGYSQNGRSNLSSLDYMDLDVQERWLNLPFTGTLSPLLIVYFFPSHQVESWLAPSWRPFRRCCRVTSVRQCGRYTSMCTRQWTSPGVLKSELMLRLRWGIYKQWDTVITWAMLLKILTIDTHSSPSRVSYGVSIVCSKSDLCSIFVWVVLCAVASDIEPRYSSVQLCIECGAPVFSYTVTPHFPNFVSWDVRCMLIQDWWSCWLCSIIYEICLWFCYDLLCLINK